MSSLAEETAPLTALDKAKGALAELAGLQIDYENPGDRRLGGMLLDIAEVQAAIAQAEALEALNSTLALLVTGKTNGD